MTLEELNRRLAALHRRMGGEGRIALTLTQEPGPAPGAYVTHWVKPDGSSFEDCIAVGQGTVEQCLAALERYAAAYRRRPTVEEVGRTLGVLPARGGAHLRVAAE